MRKLLLILFFITTSISAFCQTSYGFTQEYTTWRIRKFNYTPKVFEVINKEFSFTRGPRKLKRKVPKYFSVEAEIAKEEAKEKSTFEVYNKKMSKYNKINSIVKKIDVFLTSKKPYDLKKSLLIEAQKIADSYNLNTLIYADQNINTSKKSKFLVLTLNKFDLKVHLKRVVWKINEINVKPDIQKPEKSIRLEELREEFKTLKPYKYITTPGKSWISNGMAMGIRVANVPLLVGNFTEIDKYYLILNDFKRKYKKGQLVKKSEIEKLGLTSSRYVETAYRILMKSEKSGKSYMVENDYFEKYAFTFNGLQRSEAKERLRDGTRKPTVMNVNTSRLSSVID